MKLMSDHLRDEPMRKTSDGPRWLPLSIITGVFALAVVVVQPFGDFPLNDDWGFAMAAWHFAETGEFAFARMTAMTLRLQVLWGALWTVLLWPDFEVLRASTLVLALVTLITAHEMLKEANVALRLRVLAVLALLFHPVFFLNSFTFMTHVPFVCVSMLALYFFFRGLAEDRMSLFLVGSLAVVGSFFIRQTGIANAVPPLMALVFARSSLSRHWKRYLIVITSVIGMFVLLFFATDALVGYPGIIDAHYEVWDGSAREVIWRLAEIPARWTTYTFIYAALFLLPLMIPLIRGWRQLTRRETLMLGIVLLPFAQVTTELHRLGRPLPFTGEANVISNFAMGPLTLRDTWVFGYQYPLHLPDWTLALLNYTGGLLGAFLLFHVLRAWWNNRRVVGKRELLMHLSAVQCLVATALLGVSGLYYDRYVIDASWALVFLLALAGDWSKRWTQLIAVSLLVPLAMFALFGVREYFEWNRARWIAFDYLTGRGVRLEQMDGGYEINQYLLGGWDGEIQLNLVGMSVVDDEFILSFNEVRGYRTLKAFPYEGFMGLRRGAIYAQEREEGFHAASRPGVQP